MSNTKKQLGEIALSVSDLRAMKVFYRDVIGLELIRESPNFVFFRIADGFEGHTQVLALFDRSETIQPNGKLSTLDHLAFSVSQSDFEIEKTRLLGLGCKLSYAFHDWVNWNSLYLTDPEGNTVEFVCYDEHGTI
jgi:catechol-2,3-dioxygenase